MSNILQRTAVSKDSEAHEFHTCCSTVRTGGATPASVRFDRSQREIGAGEMFSRTVHLIVQESLGNRAMYMYVCIVVTPKPL